MDNDKCTSQIVNMNQTLSYVIGLLEKYDKNLEKGIIEGISPYYDKIYMQGNNNKTIEVPYDVQQEAIKIWNVKKLYISYEKEKHNIQNEMDVLEKELNQINDEKTEDENDIHTDNNISVYILFVIIVLLILGFGYYLYKKN